MDNKRITFIVVVLSAATAVIGFATAIVHLISEFTNLISIVLQAIL